MMKSIYKVHKTGIAFSILLFLVCILGCEKLVEVNPPVTSTTGASIYTTDGNAITVLNGIYSYLIVNGGSASGPESITLFAGLSADELSLSNGIDRENALSYYYRNALYANIPTITPGTEYWSSVYNLIFTCNSAIEGLNNSTNLTTSVKQQLLGEAKFMRAFFYFYLVNLYGDVPLVLTSDYTKNAELDRSPKSQVYLQIIDDLKNAQGLLSPNYLDGNLQAYSSGNPERVRPTKWAADALLARVYLYTADYPDAKMMCDSVINNASLYNLDSLNGVFLKNSPEAIWQLQPITLFFNTRDALLFVIPSTGFSNNNPVYLSGNLLGSFEVGDQRAAIGNWVDSTNIGGNTYYYPYKYKMSVQDPSVTSASSMSEYLMVLRLGEQYLIRAEAEAYGAGGGTSAALADLNSIRSRASLPAYAGPSDQASLLAAILHERQVELFTEWGQRWLDLKRTGNVDAVMSVVTPIKSNGSGWLPSQQLYPLPLADLQKDANLVQNPGY